MVEYRFGNHFIRFGDGNQAQLIDKDTIDEGNGTSAIAMLMIPSQNLIDKFSLKKDEEIMQNGMVYRKYPEEYVVSLIESPNYSRIQVLTDFMGGKTNWSIKEELTIFMIQRLKRDIFTLSVAIGKLHEETHMIATQPHLAMREHTELALEGLKVRAKRTHPDQESDVLDNNVPEY